MVIIGRQPIAIRVLNRSYKCFNLFQPPILTPRGHIGSSFIEACHQNRSVYPLSSDIY